MNGNHPDNLDSTREALAILFIACALCTVVYNEVKVLAPQTVDTPKAFLAFGRGERYAVFDDATVGHMDLGKAWRPRILSNMAGSLFTREALRETGNVKMLKFSRLVGIYSAFWLGLTFLVYVLCFGRHALLPILGTFAAVASAYAPGVGVCVFPWDLPALFFVAVFTCLLVKDRLGYFLFVLPAAVLFKETAAVLSLAYLFLPGSTSKRLARFSAAAAVCVVAKLVADVLTDSTGRFSADTTLLFSNLHYILFGAFPNKTAPESMTGYSHPLFLNAGLLVAFVLFPFRGPHSLMLKAIVLCFSIGTLLYGIVFEYRIWFEVTPLLLYPFCVSATAQRRDDGARPPVPSPCSAI